MWGTARGEHGAMIRDLGATPIDYQREDFRRVLPGGFDIVIDGIGEDGYRRSFAALKPGGLLIGIGFSSSVQAHQRMRTIMMSIARMYLWRFLPGGKRSRFYSITVMRARHPAWFREDLERLFGLLAAGPIRPRVAERISFDPPRFEPKAAEGNQHSPDPESVPPGQRFRSSRPEKLQQKR